MMRQDYIGRFPWPDGEVEPDESPLGELPRTGPLAAFHEVADVLSSPPSPDRPYVLASGDRVVKAYDLRAFDALDRRRALAEAETAIALSDIDGVVTTYRTGEIGHWLVIEMERLGETVADHLAGVDAGVETPLAPARWGELLEEAAAGLERIHQRHLIHRDVKPANLMFDLAGERLVIADFSISSKRTKDRGSRGTGDAELAGTRRYIAPEVFQGRMSYAVDQYALAVTAEDILGDVASTGVREVLLRATEQDPDYRFTSIANFGVALRAAIDDKAPRRLSSRLRPVSPAWRISWGVGAAAFVGAYALLLWIRAPHLAWLAGLVIPSIAAGLTAVATRALGWLRGGRTQPRLGPADQPWFPVLLFAIAFISLRPISIDNPGEGNKVIFYSWAGALLVTALLGSTPRNSGEWLIRIVQRWETRRQARSVKPLHRWGSRLAFLGGLFVLTCLPVAVSARWPNDAKLVSAATYRQVAVVAKTRDAMLDGNPRAACNFVRIPADPGVVPCDEWAPIASRWLRRDVSNQGAPALTSGDLEDVQISFNNGSEKYGAPSWSIWTGNGEREYIGAMSEENASDEVWEVVVTSNPPQHDPLAFQKAYWGYEVVRKADRWMITSVEICNNATLRNCAQLGQLKRADLSEIRRLDSPG
jgi:tRNA A-37 threonylcarbamoyl transferase component Bud32